MNRVSGICELVTPQADHFAVRIMHRLRAPFPSLVVIHIEFAAVELSSPLEWHDRVLPQTGISHPPVPGKRKIVHLGTKPGTFRRKIRHGSLASAGKQELHAAENP